ncbi:hypothetical protein Tco_1203777 [Tanacetum coccineum]
MDVEHGSEKKKSPEKMKSAEKMEEEDVATQKEMKEVSKETVAKRKKSIPRKSTRKRQKMEEDAEKEELKGFLDIIPREEVPIEVESLFTKFPVVDWKTCVLTENFMYYQVFRGDGSSKNYKVLSEMLEDFDRQDVEELYRLVKEKYSASRLEGFDLMLWGDLYTLFESDEEDEIWKNQHEYNLISWRLCDFCGIHILLMENGLAIHMLTEKKYPLSQELLSKMLSKKLEVDHESSQAFELLRPITSLGEDLLEIYLARLILPRKALAERENASKGSKISYDGCLIAKSWITYVNTSENTTLSEAQGVSLRITSGVRFRRRPPTKGVGLRVADSYTGNHPEDDFTPLETIRRAYSVNREKFPFELEGETFEPERGLRHQAPQ